MRPSDNVTGLKKAVFPKNFKPCQSAAFLLVALGLLIATPATAQAQFFNTEAGYVGTATGNWSGGGSGVVGLPDGSCANMGAQGKANFISNFEFNVPGTATITGVTAFSKLGSANPETVTFQLADDVTVPSFLGAAQNVDIPGGGGGACNTTGPGQFPLDTANNLPEWGNPALTPAIVNSPNFGLGLTTNSQGTVKFDSVCLQIAYLTDTGPGLSEQCLTAPPAGANLQVIKTVVGAPPNSDWDFVWQDVGGVTSTPFTLAAAGASQGFTDITIGQHIVGEVVKPGYTVSAECTVNEVPIEDLLPDNPADVAFVIADGQNVVCTFINTLNSTTYTVAKDFSDDAADVVGVSLSCTSGTVSPLGVQNLSEGSPVDFTVTGAVGTPNCTATESNIPAGYTSDTSACVDDPLGSGGCTITNTLNSANFTVAKDFSDDAADVVGVTLSCDTGTVSPAGVQNLSEAASVQFTVNGYTGDPNCTAVESNIPAGYTSSAAACTAVALSAGTCTITNTLNTAQFTVNKDFSDDAADVVGVELSCVTGTVTPAGVQNLSEAAPVQFTVNGYTGDPNCTAVESSIPAGYTSDATACTAVALSAGTCTITNTLNTAQFTVNKDFSDDAADVVGVELSCVTGTVTPAGVQNLSEAAPVQFTVDGFTDDPNCTAVESNIPAGYTPDATACTAVALSTGSCTITNTVNTGTFTVRKTFTDGNPMSVEVTATCTPPAVVDNNPQQASMSASAIFDVSYVVDGVTTCTAVETVPAGYEVDDSSCQAPTAINGGCALINTPISAEILVTKTFSDGNPADIDVRLTCDAGTDLVQEFPLSDGEQVTFSVSGYDPTTDCWLQEISGGTTGYLPQYVASATDGVATGVRSELDGCYFDEIASGGFVCDLTNVLQPVEVEVTKEWIGDLEQIQTITDLYALATWDCFDVRTGPFGSKADVSGSLWFEGEEDTESFFVYPDWEEEGYCRVRESSDISVVEGDDSDCAKIDVEVGLDKRECTIFNTVFFEGIPTLSRPGIILMALLMLGIGLVGFRRFV